MKVSMLILFVLMTQATCSKHVPRRKNNQKTTAYPCCITDEFTISYAGNVGYAYMTERFESMRVSIDAAFDFDYSKFGKDLTFYDYEYGIYQRYKVYDLIGKNVRYVVSEYGDCYETYDAPEIPLQCVPDDASYDKSVSIGDQDMYLDSWTTRGTFFYGDMSASVTDDCIPVFANAAGTFRGEVSFVAEGAFMNFTDIIYDRDYWFTPPPSCYNATKIKSLSSVKSLRLLKLMQETNLFL